MLCINTRLYRPHRRSRQCDRGNRPHGAAGITGAAGRTRRNRTDRRDRGHWPGRPHRTAGGGRTSRCTRSDRPDRLTGRCRTPRRTGRDRPDRAAGRCRASRRAGRNGSHRANRSHRGFRPHRGNRPAGSSGTAGRTRSNGSHRSGSRRCLCLVRGVSDAVYTGHTGDSVSGYHGSHRQYQTIRQPPADFAGTGVLSHYLQRLVYLYLSQLSANDAILQWHLTPGIWSLLRHKRKRIQRLRLHHLHRFRALCHVLFPDVYRFNHRPRRRSHHHLPEAQPHRVKTQLQYSTTVRPCTVQRHS